MPGQSFSRERRDAVLSRAVEVGVEPAAREAGVQPTTVERWRSKAEARAEADDVEQVDGELMVTAAPAVSPSPVEEDDENLETQLQRTAQAARRAAEQAIARLEAALPTARNVQGISIAVGVLLDKARQLEQVLQESEERRARLDAAQAQVVAALLEAFCEALGVDGAPSLRSVMRGLLEQASAGGVLVVQPSEAEALRVEVRNRLLPDVSAFELAAARFDRPELPAPVDADVVEGGPNSPEVDA